MPGFTVQRSGFIRVPELFHSVMSDLIANGFTLAYPTTAPVAPTVGTNYAPFKVTLEAGPTRDPLQATQPWRLQLNATSTQSGDIYIATPLQLASDGTVAVLSTTGNTTAVPAGMLNGANSIPSASNSDSTKNHFIARDVRVPDKATSMSYPMSYRLSITAHGVALCVWEDAADSFTTAPRFSWFVAQRPVDHITGVPLTSGHCPLICLFGLEGNPYKFVVRESDILKPTIIVEADVDGEDSSAIINSFNQVAITENNRYVITFPNGINTPRYMYTEELDMVAYTSADVVSQYSDVPITVYGEAAARTYTALNANASNNTGMRILFLKTGAGIA